MACRIVSDNRARIKAEIRARLGEIVADGAEAVAEAARANAPVELGRDSIEVQTGVGMKRGVRITDARAVAVEFGTTTRAATPVLSPAFDQAVPEVQRETRKIVE